MFLYKKTLIPFLVDGFILLPSNFCDFNFVKHLKIENKIFHSNFIQLLPFQAHAHEIKLIIIILH